MKAVAPARTAALLSLLWLVVYGSCNWITGHRSDVGTLFFEWERRIPFVPLMIIPYMSIDLFFLGAPFLCRDSRERQVFARRVSFGIVVAGICFLLFPLRFAFERPAVSGWLGLLFDAFRKVDQPYNLLPSLHITLRTILAHLYARHTTGLWRAASGIWFSLVGFSTVLTYQHHVMDVVGGFVLAGFCFYFFPESYSKLRVLGNQRVGSYYGVGALVCAAFALLLWSWSSLLFWPALAFMIVAAAHFGLGPGIFRKRDGRLPFSTWFVLAPFLWGQELSLVHYRRRCRKWDEVVHGVLIGRKLTDAEAAEAVGLGVTAVLDLTAEFSEAPLFLAVRYLNVPLLDLTAPTQEQLQQVAAFIEEESRSGSVYVHCKVGYSRSAAAVGAWLLASGRVGSVEEALDLLRKARRSIIIRPETVEALRMFATNRRLKASEPFREN
jgi:membrane-associated phospholipid phosphatase